MSPSKVSRRIFLDRIGWIDRMMSEIRALPLNDVSVFMKDSRNLWTAESCLRRALEAIFDLGRHVLAKGYAMGVTEYREIADALASKGVVASTDAGMVKTLAGYRNRLVHFYHEVSADELFEICATQLADVERIRGAFLSWLEAHPEMVDTSL